MKKSNERIQKVVNEIIISIKKRYLTFDKGLKLFSCNLSTGEIHRVEPEKEYRKKDAIQKKDKNGKILGYVSQPVKLRLYIIPKEGLIYDVAKNISTVKKQFDITLSEMEETLTKKLAENGAE